MNQLIYKHKDPVDQGGYKNSPGRFIPVGINIYSKQDSVGKQGNTADRRQELLIVAQNIYIFGKTDRAAEHPEIVNGHGQNRTDKAEQDAKFEIVFFEYQNFQDFSSLDFKT
jgi:hypothetical protein